jgi:ribonuclease VapC
MSVIDASALLSYLQGEDGADLVGERLEEGAACGAANWSEVAQKIRAADRDWDLARALLQSHDLSVEQVTEQDAEWAALRWRRGEGLSLADRLCLALGDRFDVDVWTADRTWGTGGRVRQIR